jgi:hypothetical protein
MLISSCEPGFKLPMFSLTRSAFYYIILTMEKAMPDAHYAGISFRIIGDFFETENNRQKRE